MRMYAHARAHHLTHPLHSPFLLFRLSRSCLSPPPPPPSSRCCRRLLGGSCSFHSLSIHSASQEKRTETDEAVRQDDEATAKEIAERDRLALSNFLLGTSDMKSPTGARMHTLSTVIEEGSPTESTPSEKRGMSHSYLFFYWFLVSLKSIVQFDPCTHSARKCRDRWVIIYMKIY